MAGNAVRHYPVVIFSYKKHASSTGRSCLIICTMKVVQPTPFPAFHMIGQIDSPCLWTGHNKENLQSSISLLAALRAGLHVARNLSLLL